MRCCVAVCIYSYFRSSAAFCSSCYYLLWLRPHMLLMFVNAMRTENVCTAQICHSDFFVCLWISEVAQQKKKNMRQMKSDDLPCERCRMRLNCSLTEEHAIWRYICSVQAIKPNGNRLFFSLVRWRNAF